MTIIADLIFITIDAMLDTYKLEGEEEVLVFADDSAVINLVQEINYQFSKFEQFDNFNGGYCLTDSSLSCLSIIMYISDEDGINICTKNFEITY